MSSFNRLGNPHGECRCVGNASAIRAEELAGGQVPGHTLSARHLKPGVSLLGNPAQLCHAFWHVPETPEAPEVLPVCLRAATQGGAGCVGKGTVLIAKLEDVDGVPRYIARYSNCPDNEHAEQFLIRDAALRDELTRTSEDATRPAVLVEGEPPCARAGKLVLYLNRQPCHHSSDHLRTVQSCTVDLLRFHQEHLYPRKIDLEVAICYTYRAHWELANLHTKRERQRYGPAIQAAREGIALLNGVEGVLLRAMQLADWDWLVSLCDERVQSDWAAAGTGEEGTVFTDRVRTARQGMDRFTEHVLRTHGRSAWGVPASRVPASPLPPPPKSAPPPLPIRPPAASAYVPPHLRRAAALHSPESTAAARIA